MSDDFWGEPIHVYTTDQAVEDGILVELSGLRLRFQGRPVTHMTRTLYTAFEPFIVAFKDGPMIDNLGFAMPIPAVEGDPEWAAALASTLRTKLSMARGSGDRYVLPGGGDDGPIVTALNEQGGWTVMFASDD